MKKNQAEKIIFVLLFLVLFLPFFAGCRLKKSQTPVLPAPNPAAETSQSKEDIVLAYEKTLPEILKPYWSKSDFSGAKEKILALKAPAQYLDLHMNLAIAFELLEQGKNEASQEKIEEAISKIEKLKSQYPWLDASDPNKNDSYQP